MSEQVETSRWFALVVKSRYEKKVSTTLSEKGYRQFLPVYRGRHRHAGKLRWVDLPLFPSYTFCHFDPRRRLPVLMTPGVLSIVGMGGTPVPVEDGEIEAIQALANSRVDLKPWPFMKAGDRVRIEEGPLTGLEGVLVRDEIGHRVVVSVSLLQRSVAAEVDRHWVRPAESLTKAAGGAAGSNGNRS